MRDTSPDWVVDGLRQAREEVSLFLRTAVDFTVHPRRFAEQWANGERHALNPLGFLATALAVLAPTRAAHHAIVHAGGGTDSLGLEALGSILPFTYYLLIGGLQHAVLRLFGSRRPLRASCAMAAYAGGGPALAVTLVITGLMLCFYAATGQSRIVQAHGFVEWALVVLVWSSFGVFLGILAAALGAIHRPYGIRGWHLLVATLVALLITGALFAIFAPPGNFGMHLVAGPCRENGVWTSCSGIYL